MTRPPGPSIQMSSTDTELGGGSPGVHSSTAPAELRITGGLAEDDQANSIVPSGRAVAPDTTPGGVSTW